MAINFPSAPNTGDSHTDGSVTWIYNGSAWDSLYQPTAKAQVGLGNVDNTSDEAKPVSTAQQAALDALTKDDVGLDNVDNTSDINKPVSTAQQAAIDAAGGGSSFDQDLNTTDSPTFATLTTTNTIATDVYAVDLDASGTVTANFSLATLFQVGGGSFYGDFGSSGLTIKRGNGLRFATAGSVDGGLFQSTSGDFELGNGTSGSTSGSLSLADLDATGTVTAGSSFQIATGSGTAGIGHGTSRHEIAENGSLYAYRADSLVFVFGNGHNLSYQSFKPNGLGKDLGDPISRRWQTTYTEDLDATGTVTAGGFVGTPQTLTDAATITYDLAAGHNAKVTLTADRTLLFPTNVAEGASGVLTVTQDGTGGHALTFGTGWFISAGAAADIAALGAGEKAQVTWYAHSTSDANATILPLQ